jgi:hypothetical protein
VGILLAEQLVIEPVQLLFDIELAVLEGVEEKNLMMSVGMSHSV